MKKLQDYNENVDILIHNIDEVIERSNEEFNLLRDNTIGASDAGVLLNVNPYNTTHALLVNKTNHIYDPSISDKPAVKKGKELEPIILNHALDLLKLEEGNFQKPKDMYVLCNTNLSTNFDGLYMSDDMIFPVEAKVCTKFGRKHYLWNRSKDCTKEDLSKIWKETKESFAQDVEFNARVCGIPPYYFVQVQQQILFCGKDCEGGVLAVLDDDLWEYKLFPIPRDFFTINKILSEAHSLEDILKAYKRE